jgi:hypothetical protein
MANKIIFQIETESNLDVVDKQINDIVKSSKSAKAQLKELSQAALEATDPASQERFARAAGELKDRIEDNSRAIRNFASDTRKLDVVIGSIQGIAGAFAAVQGTVALLAGENENLNKILVKVQGSLAILNGLQQVSNSLNRSSAEGAALYAAKQKILNFVIAGGSTALKGLRAALIATGFGAIAVSVGLLIANFEDVSKWVKDLTEKFGGWRKVLLLVAPPIFLIIKALEKLGIIDDEATEKSKAAAKARLEASKVAAKEAEKEIAVLKARGATAEEIYAKESKLLNDQISALENSLKVKDKLNKEEQELYDKLIQDKKILDAGYARFQEDQDEKRRDKEKQNRERFLAAERADSQRRINLLDEGLKKRLATLDLAYAKDIEAARKNGENLALVEADFAKQRIQIIKEETQRLVSLRQGLEKSILELEGKNYQIRLKEINDFYEETLRSLTQNTEAEIKTLNDKGKILLDEEKNNLEKLSKLRETFNEKEKEKKKISDIVSGVGLPPEEFKEIKQLNKEIKETKAEIDKLESLEVTRKSKLIKLNNDLAKANEELTKTQESSNDVIQKANELRERQIKALESSTIIEGLKSEIKLRESLGKEDLTLQSALIFEQFQTFRNFELAKIEEKLQSELKLNRITEDFLKSELEQYQKYYDELENLEIKRVFLAAKTAKLEEKRVLKTAETEIASIKAKEAIYKDEQLSEVDRAKALLKIDEELKKEQLEQEEEFLKQKLAILAKDPTRSPEEAAEINRRLSEINLEFLRLDFESKKKASEEAKALRAQEKASLNAFQRELFSQTENITSAYSQLLSESQVQLDRLRDQGELSQKEYEARSKKLFEDQKNIEIGRTLISTFSSAQSAFQSQFVPVPDPSSPIRGSIAAAAAVAAGLLRVAAIRKQTYRGGAGSVPQQPLQTSFLRDPGTSQIITPDRPDGILPSLRVFVTENDISETQRRVRVIQNGANQTF